MIWAKKKRTRISNKTSGMELSKLILGGKEDGTINEWS